MWIATTESDYILSNTKHTQENHFSCRPRHFMVWQHWIGKLNDEKKNHESKDEIQLPCRLLLYYFDLITYGDRIHVKWYGFFIFWFWFYFFFIFKCYKIYRFTWFKPTIFSFSIRDIQRNLNHIYPFQMQKVLLFFSNRNQTNKNCSFKF